MEPQMSKREKRMHVANEQSLEPSAHVTVITVVQDRSKKGKRIPQSCRNAERSQCRERERGRRERERGRRERERDRERERERESVRNRRFSSALQSCECLDARLSSAERVPGFDRQNFLPSGTGHRDAAKSLA